jgi:putative hydrolase of the HAD superfamily
VIEVVVSDFGGVLTNPLWEGFAHVNEQLGVPLDALNKALTALHEETGVHPLHALERGELTEPDFLAQLEARVAADLGRDVAIRDFPEHYWQALRVNEPVLEELGLLRARGYRLALLTNNVREWEPRWRAMLPVDELFEVVVDSAFVGLRKPEPEIYALTCSRLAAAPETCVLLDDFENNCQGARDAGMHAVRFDDTAQALGQLRALLSEHGAHG